MSGNIILENHAPELDDVIGAALFPGGPYAPSRMEGEAVLSQYYGQVVGWFTVMEATSTGEHPDFAKEAWKGVPLPVRDDFYDPGSDSVQVLAIDAFNGLADNRVNEEVLQYWADTFAALGERFLANDLPTTLFDRGDGTLEDNALLDY